MNPVVKLYSPNSNDSITVLVAKKQGMLQKGWLEKPPKLKIQQPSTSIKK